MELKQSILLLWITGLVDAMMKLSPPTADVSKGQPHIFTCQGRPNSVINFEDRERSLVVCIVNSKGAEAINTDGYSCGVSTGDNSVYTMTIASVNLADDSDKWYCQIGTNKSEFVTLRVKYRPEIEFFVNGNARDWVGQEGDEVQFECAAQGYPLPTVTLLKNGNRVAGGTNDTLKHVISSATCRDTGTYTCDAVNTEGGRRSALKLQVNCMPSSVEVQPEPFEASVQGTVTLQVQVLAHPSPRFTWYSPSGSALQSRNGTLNPDLTSSSQLVINEVTEEDFGEYHVTVTNELGTTNVTVSLISKAEAGGTNQLTVAIAVSCVILVLLVIILVVVMVKKLKRRPEDTERDVLDNEPVEDPANLYAQVRKPQDRRDQLRNVEGAKEGRDEDGLMYVRLNLENGSASGVTNRSEEGPTLYAMIDHDATADNEH